MQSNDALRSVALIRPFALMLVVSILSCITDKIHYSTFYYVSGSVQSPKRDYKSNLALSSKPTHTSMKNFSKNV